MNMYKFRSAVMIGLTLALGGLGGAQAQTGQNTIPSRDGPSARPVVGANPDSALPARVPRAVGLPGAQTDPDRVAPADRPGSEMRPTEALFDAINRGDITAARDAINRGAEMNGRNILGFTPVELAVDLGRRDIAFLLLSLRGSETRPEARGARPATAANAQTQAQQERAAKLEAQRAEAARRAAARVAPTTGPAVPQGPRLFAGDGGAPVPDAGFLGFGGGAGGNAAGGRAGGAR